MHAHDGRDHLDGRIMSGGKCLASLAMGRPLLSQHIIKAFNFQAISCLHISPGEYRPCEVSVGTHAPPDFYRVPALMDDFVNVVIATGTKPMLLF